MRRILYSHVKSVGLYTGTFSSMCPMWPLQKGMRGVGERKTESDTTSRHARAVVVRQVTGRALGVEVDRAKGLVVHASAEDKAR